MNANRNGNGVNCDTGNSAQTVEPEVCPPGSAYPMNHRYSSPITCNVNQLLANPCFWALVVFGSGVYVGYKLANKK